MGNTGTDGERPATVEAMSEKTLPDARQLDGEPMTTPAAQPD
jgi:hypothetical protein